MFLNDSSQDPLAKQTLDTTLNLYVLGADEVALRLEQVLNTYWIAQSAESAVPGLGLINVTQLFFNGDAETNSTFTLNTTATFHNWTDFLICDRSWLAILCFATIIMFCAATMSTVFTVLNTGPKAHDFLSALTKLHHALQLDHGSYLHEDELVRELKDVKLKIGDARTEDDVGKIVIGPSNRLGNLERGRLMRDYGGYVLADN